jgi:hypothetical protein
MTNNTIRLHRHVAKLFIEALRSDEFPQSKGALQDEDGYCCLCVLAELARRNGVNIEYHPPTEDTHAMYDGETEFPPDSVQDWAGDNIPDNTFSIMWTDDDGERLAVPLTELNDDEGLTFAQIADAVEAHCEEEGYTDSATTP